MNLNNGTGKSEDNNKIFNHNKCGKSHGINECPAYGKNYNNCGKSNHFAKIWFIRSVTRGSNKY